MRVLRSAAVLALLVGLPCLYLTQPLLRRDVAWPPARADAAALERDVRHLCTAFAPRDAAHPEHLARAADFLRARLAQTLGAAKLQTFEVGGVRHHNVCAVVGPAGGERVVVGAHYDAAEPGIGADDNASGVAGLLELARLLAGTELACEVELVAFALEEPPHFRTPAMGSALHAAELRRSGVRVRAMLCLEMIGCYRDEPGSQAYPVPLLGWLYPSRGDFVAVVGTLGQAGLVRRVKQAMARATPLPVRSINAPAFLPGIDFSDHASYWAVGLEAVMITDTAFYRNPRYHSAADTPETLDYRRMAQVVDGVHAAVRALAGE
ncbi:MAG TPA: M28 family peptidase [Planctomycetota bacterium]